MKVVILAGGYGSRLSEETTLRPKPMVEVGGRPIIWHIMKLYSHFGFNEFIILAGYKAEYIKNYFLNYAMCRNDFTVDLATGEVTTVKSSVEPWKVTVLDTGVSTMTGGRIKRARHVIGEERFLLTYGDGVANTDIGQSIELHERDGNWITLTAVTQPGRYGALSLSGDATRVRSFREKGARDGGLINGGFFVCEPQVYDLIDGDDDMWEDEPMARAVTLGKVGSYWHQGFWQSMDSLRDKMVLEKAWESGAAPWAIWT